MPDDLTSQKTTALSVGWSRWGICGLLFFATTINYIDRQVIGILKPDLSKHFGWNEIDYSNIIFAFQIAYALGYAGAGRLMDRMGVRLGYALSVLVWSLAAMAHALNWYIPMGAKFWIMAIPASVIGFSAARFALGLAEGGCFPASVKSVSEWFPKKERALAFGIFNAGSNVGAVTAPLLVPWLTIRFGWPTAFIATGAFGFVWLVFWQLYYQSPEKHPRLTPAELDYIRSDPPDPAVKIPWLTLLRYRQTWVFVVGMFLSSPIWWFYLYWIPDFLNKRFGVTLLQSSLPIVTIYLIADIGSIAGGWFSSWLIKRGWTINAARKTTMLVCALCIVPVFAASSVSNLWAATLLVGLAASAHQGFSANLFTLVSDTAPRKVVSSIVGIGGMAGAIGGMFIAKLAGYVLEWTGEYQILFIIAASVYLVNLFIIHLINPRLKSMEFAQT